jgi:hypothetical protein
MPNAKRKNSSVNDPLREFKHGRDRKKPLRAKPTESEDDEMTWMFSSDKLPLPGTALFEVVASSIQDEARLEFKHRPNLQSITLQIDGKEWVIITR